MRVPGGFVRYLLRMAETCVGVTMSFPYIVVRGDNLSSIARRHGLGSWMDIYFHPDNGEFRLKRRNPNLIFPGDVVMIPGGDPGFEDCVNECRRRFLEDHTLPFNERMRRFRRCERDCRGRPA